MLGGGLAFVKNNKKLLLLCFELHFEAKENQSKCLLAISMLYYLLSFRVLSKQSNGVLKIELWCISCVTVLIPTSKHWGRKLIEIRLPYSLVYTKKCEKMEISLVGAQSLLANSPIPWPFGYRREVQILKF